MSTKTHHDSATYLQLVKIALVAVIVATFIVISWFRKKHKIVDIICNVNSMKYIGFYFLENLSHKIHLIAYWKTFYISNISWFRISYFSNIIKFLPIRKKCFPAYMHNCEVRYFSFSWNFSWEYDTKKKSNIPFAWPYISNYLLSTTAI